MKLVLTRRFVKDYSRLEAAIKDKTDKQLRLIVFDLAHPSLKVKKMKGHYVWEARVDYHYRMTFELEKDYIIMRRVGTHQIYTSP